MRKLPSYAIVVHTANSQVHLNRTGIHANQARTQGGGVHWVHVHPPPGKKVPLRNVQKRRESSAQICRQKKMCTFRSDTTKLKRKR